MLKSKTIKKNPITYLILSLFIALLIATPGYAANNTNDLVLETNDYIKDKISEEILTEGDVSKVLDRVVALNLVTINENGEIILLASENEIGISNKQYKKLIEKIESINFLVGKGLVEVDNSYNVIIPSLEEIANISSDMEAEESINITPLAIDPGLPSLPLTSIVTTNRRDIEKVFNAFLKTNPMQASSATIGYFVGQVREGGPQDYKVHPNYRYWYKEWNASTYQGNRVVTTEYLGNYNYAFVGEFLFSKQILLIGGGAVGIGVGIPDDAKDKEAITQGYNDAVTYW